MLAKRQLKVRYRQTVVGAAWALIQPLSMMVIFSVFFGILSRFDSGGVPYPVFTFTGLMVWIIVAKTLSEGSSSVAGNGSLITKIWFPRAYLPLSVAIASIVDFGFGCIALLPLLLFYGIVPGIPIIVLPLILALVLAATVGASFWLAALNAEYRDVAQLMPFLIQMWFFLTPIIYPSTIVPAAFRPLYWLNPIAVAVDAMRWALAGSAAPSLAEWLVGSLVATFLLVTGYVFFRYREPRFADVV